MRPRWCGGPRIRRAPEGRGRDLARGGVALQLYTLREDLSKDFRGTLQKVAAMGYPAVEFAGYGGLGPEEIKALCTELGLKVAGTHTGIEALQTDLAKVVALHRTVGSTHVTVPSIPGARYSRDAAGFTQAAKDLEALAVRLAGEGLTLAYHNHDFEFFPTDGGYGLDLLYAQAPHLHAELDVYWAAKGGVDPAAYIRKLGSRCSLLHVKDRSESGAFAPVGAGNLDFQSILAAGDAVGTEWFIVEQDRCVEQTALESVRISLENLRKWGRL